MKVQSDGVVDVMVSVYLSLATPAPEITHHPPKKDGSEGARPRRLCVPSFLFMAATHISSVCSIPIIAVRIGGREFHPSHRVAQSHKKYHKSLKSAEHVLQGGRIGRRSHPRRREVKKMQRYYYYMKLQT